MLRCRCLRCGSLVSRRDIRASCLVGEIPAEPRQRSPPTPRQGPQVARPASRVTPTSSNEVCRELVNMKLAAIKRLLPSALTLAWC